MRALGHKCGIGRVSCLSVRAACYVCVCVSYTWVSGGYVASEEGQSVGQLSDSQGLQAPHTLSLVALSSSNTRTSL